MMWGMWREGGCLDMLFLNGGEPEGGAYGVGGGRTDGQLFYVPLSLSGFIPLLRPRSYSLPTRSGG